MGILRPLFKVGIYQRQSERRQRWQLAMGLVAMAVFSAIFGGTVAMERCSSKRRSDKIQISQPPPGAALWQTVSNPTLVHTICRLSLTHLCMLGFATLEFFVRTRIFLAVVAG